MNENTDRSPGVYTLSQDLTVLSPSATDAYPIPCEEWSYLRSKIQTISHAINIYHTIASLLVGAALTMLITIITGAVPATSNGSPRIVICWAVFAVLLICGTVTACFAREHSKVKKVSTQDVLAQMDVIEMRYSRDRDGI